jgi:uracil-DNA glycosylase family 4
MFTGDRSGEYLYRALFKAGFSSQAESTNRNDGLRLSDCYITAAVRCAPPGNKPAPEEFRNCRPYLLEEISQLNRVHVVLGLGKIGFDTALAAVTTARDIAFVSRPKFAHGAVYQVGDVHFVCSYHPSQQNTFTGRLTEPMFDEVFRRIRRLLQ